MVCEHLIVVIDLMDYSNVYYLIGKRITHIVFSKLFRTCTRAACTNVEVHKSSPSLSNARCFSDLGMIEHLNGRGRLNRRWWVSHHTWRCVMP